MNQQKIDIVDSQNWQAMYLNGKLVIEVQKQQEGDRLGAGEVLKALGIPYELYDVDYQSPKEYFADLKL